MENKPKPKLLLVDDDEEIRTQMRWALSGEYEPILAGDRPGAIAAFRTHRPAVVLLDLGLRGVIGIDLIARHVSWYAPRRRSLQISR